MLVFILELLYSALKHCILRKLHVSVFQLAKNLSSFQEEISSNCLKNFFQQLFIENTYYANFGQLVSPLGELYSHVTLTTEINVILPKHKYILTASFFTHPEN